MTTLGSFLSQVTTPTLDLLLPQKVGDRAASLGQQCCRAAIVNKNWCKWNTEKMVKNILEQTTCPMMKLAL